MIQQANVFFRYFPGRIQPAIDRDADDDKARQFAEEARQFAEKARQFAEGARQLVEMGQSRHGGA